MSFSLVESDFSTEQDDLSVSKQPSIQQVISKTKNMGVPFLSVLSFTWTKRNPLKPRL